MNRLQAKLVATLEFHKPIDHQVGCGTREVLKTFCSPGKLCVYIYIYIYIYIPSGSMLKALG